MNLTCCLNFSRTNHKDSSDPEKENGHDLSMENMLVFETLDAGWCHQYREKKIHCGVTQDLTSSGREKSGSKQATGKGLII